MSLEQTELRLTWRTEIVPQADGSYLVRPLAPARELPPLDGGEEGEELPVEAVAVRLRVSDRMVREMCAAQDLLAYKANGRDWRILNCSVKVWRQWQKGRIGIMERDRRIADFRDRWQGRDAE